MASLSAEQESKLRKKMQAYDRAFLDWSKASFEAARKGDRDLQVQCLEVGLGWGGPRRDGAGVGLGAERLGCVRVGRGGVG